MSHMARLTCLQYGCSLVEGVCSEDFDSRYTETILYYLKHYADIFRDIALLNRNDPEYTVYAESYELYVPSGIFTFIGNHYGHDLLLDFNYKDENKRLIFDENSLGKRQKITPSRSIYRESPIKK